MYTLHIGNKNYSSWSLRPWLLLKTQGIAFDELLHRFGRDSADGAFRRFSPSAKVPCLVDAGLIVWDSLAICEYLAERHPGIWPGKREARAFARCAAAEMHSGFGALRSTFSMNVGVRVKVARVPPSVQADISRISALWHEGLTRFGGPFLAGEHCTAVDAFFAPVVFRFRTYGVLTDATASAYAEHMLTLPAMREWEAAALAEDFRDAEDDAGLAQVGTLIADLRAPESQA